MQHGFCFFIYKARPFALLTSLLALLAAGCGSSAPVASKFERSGIELLRDFAHGADPGGPSAAPASPVGNPLEGGGLPSPADLAGRSVSYVESDLTKLGGAYVEALPHNRVSTDGYNKATFSPQAFSGQTRSLGRMSYCIYAFDLSGYDKPPVLSLAWELPPANLSNAYVGFANYSTNRWDWFNPDSSGLINLPSFDPYIKAGSSFYVAMMLAGTQSTKLIYLRLGFSYDEFENSEYTSPMQYLPPLDVADFNGNIGSAVGQSGYDGDTEDLFLFYAREQDQLELTLEYDDSAAAVQLELRDLKGNTIQSSSGQSPLSISRTVEAAESGVAMAYITSSSGCSDYSLSVTRSEAPRPWISADPWQGTGPLSVSLDASLSKDPDGSITKYEWDFEGDGVFEVDGGTNPQVEHTYSSDGPHKAQVRVTDNEGRATVAHTVISVGSVQYHELEDNDELFQLACLPVGSFEGFRGSVGQGVGYPGYDGDSSDGFLYYAQPGDELTFTLDYDPANVVAPYLSILDSDNNSMGLTSELMNGRQILSHKVNATDRMPLILMPAALSSGYMDYTLSCQSGLAPSVTFSVNQSAGLPTLELFFDASASTDNDGIVKYEWDWDGNGTTDFDGFGSPLAQHDFSIVGNYPVRLTCTDADGLKSAYSRTIFVWDTVYDEVEIPGGSDLDFNQFPSFPFSGFRASIGSGPGYPGYDGSVSDFFPIWGNVGQTVTITMHCDAATCNARMFLYTKDLTVALDTDTVDDSLLTVSHQFTADDVQPLIIWTNVSEGYSDYTLDGSKS